MGLQSKGREHYRHRLSFLASTISQIRCRMRLILSATAGSMLETITEILLNELVGLQTNSG